MRRLLAACLLLAGVAQAHAQPGQPEQTKIVIATAAASNFAAGYYAQDKGIFARHGLDATVRVVNEGSTAIAGLISGSFQFAGPTSTVFLQALDSGLDVVVAAPAYEFPTPALVGILAAPSAQIHAPKDLVGKRIGTPGVGGILDIMAREWLRRGGVDGRGVIIVELAFPQMGDALRAGQVEAVIANEPVYPRLIAQHLAEPVFDMRDMPPAGTLGGMYAATRDFVRANPNTLAAFRAAMAEAVAEIRADPESGKAVMAKLLKMPPDVLALLTMPSLTTVARKGSLTWWVGLMREQGLLSHDVDADAAILP